jgi:hypothetical protein
LLQTNLKVSKLEDDALGFGFEIDGHKLFARSKEERDKWVQTLKYISKTPVVNTRGAFCLGIFLLLLKLF